jgi:ankyrin repeat protein
VAVKNNDIRVVRFLLEKGLDPSVKGCLIIKNKVFNDITPLHLAVFYGFDDIARILIEAGANINDGCYNIIEPNTMNRGNIGNEVTLYNLTPLHLACLKGDRNLMELLLSNNGICSNFCIIDGKSILEEGNIMHLAAVKAHRKIIDFIQKENLISNKNG